MGHGVTADAARRLSRAASALSEAHAARDAAIVAADAEGMNPTDIARHVGLSRMQIYRILEKAAEGAERGP